MIWIVHTPVPTKAVWDRVQHKRDANKQKPAPTPLLAFLRPHVETAAFSAIGGSATRIQHGAFGGCILLFFFFCSNAPEKLKQTRPKLFLQVDQCFLLQFHLMGEVVCGLHSFSWAEAEGTDSLTD